jgi:glycine/D-amino acid oxidase-like deaminating enzyme
MAAAQVIVIGAGVIGLSAAIAAQSRGFKVTVIDREGPAAGLRQETPGLLPLPISFRSLRRGS